jgi:hypothetical protein
MLDNRQLSTLFYCHGVGKITCCCFCYTVALTAFTKAEQLVLWLGVFVSFICNFALCYSVWNPSQQIASQLLVMQHSARLPSRNFAQCSIAPSRSYFQFSVNSPPFAKMIWPVNLTKRDWLMKKLMVGNLVRLFLWHINPVANISS